LVKQFSRSRVEVNEVLSTTFADRPPVEVAVKLGVEAREGGPFVHKRLGGRQPETRRSDGA
jgi:hypothetical protein